MITKTDGTVDFARLSSGERMAYLDGWCERSTGIRETRENRIERPRSSETREHVYAGEGGELEVRFETRPSVMRNAGGIEFGMFVFGQVAT